MDLDLRNINKKKLILIIVAILVIAIVIFLILTRKTDEPEMTVEEPEVIQEEEQVILPPVSQEEQDKSNLLILAASFIERFGSYSNQGDYENIKDLYSFMTPSFKSWAENSYIDKLKAENPDTSTYFGITTKAISYSFDSFNDENGEASVNLTTQRRRATETMTNEEIFYQNAKIDFEKIGDEWKVDAVWWQ